jgi:hypothetical protein
MKSVAFFAASQRRFLCENKTHRASAAACAVMRRITAATDWTWHLLFTKNIVISNKSGVGSRQRHDRYGVVEQRGNAAPRRWHLGRGMGRGEWASNKSIGAILPS